MIFAIRFKKIDSLYGLWKMHCFMSAAHFRENTTVVSPFRVIWGSFGGVLISIHLREEFSCSPWCSPDETKLGFPENAKDHGPASNFRASSRVILNLKPLFRFVGRADGYESPRCLDILVSRTITVRALLLVAHINTPVLRFTAPISRWGPIRSS